VKLCNRFECGQYFDPKVSYQVYCSENCRDIATKEKIAERYKATRQKRRKKKIRKCRNCESPMSVYIEGPLCYFCNIDPKMVSKALKELKKLGVIDYEQS